MRPTPAVVSHPRATGLEHARRRNCSRPQQDRVPVVAVVAVLVGGPKLVAENQEAVFTGRNHDDCLVDARALWTEEFEAATRKLDCRFNGVVTSIKPRVWTRLGQRQPNATPGPVAVGDSGPTLLDRQRSPHRNSCRCRSQRRGRTR